MPGGTPGYSPPVVLLAVTLLLATGVSAFYAIQADGQRQIAEENFQRARAAVDEYLTRVSEEELLNSSWFAAAAQGSAGARA